MASSPRSRRRATAIAVPGTVAVLLAGAFAAAPALAASSSSASALPFPSVCPTGQSAAAGGSTASSDTSKASTPTPAGSASASAGKSSAPATSAGPSTSPSTAAAAPSASASTEAAPNAAGSASASSSAAASGNGFWGWLNGVWTWIFSDAPQTSTGSVENAVAPLSAGRGVRVEDAAETTGTAEPSAAATCIPASEASALAAAAAASPSENFTAATIPWVMKTPKMLMWNLTYNGVKSVQVWDPDSKKYVDENVLDFTGSELDITSMVTYSIQNGQTVYNNAGSGTTTTLTSPHLMVRSLTADLFGLIGVTYTPDNPPPLPVGLTIPIIPVEFTNVTSIIAGLHTDGITVPGFNGFASAGVADPQ